MKKFTLHLSPVNGGPFNCLPARFVELEAYAILSNDVIFPWESNINKVNLYVAGNEFGPLGAAWADNENNALDELCDAGLLESFLMSREEIEEGEKDGNENWNYLGNSNHPANLDHMWIQTVKLDGPRDWELIASLAEARGACADNLDF